VSRARLAAFEAALKAGNPVMAIEALGLAVGALAGQAPDPADLDTAYARLGDLLRDQETAEADPVGFDRPATLHIVTPCAQVLQQQAALLMALRARPSDRHIVLLTGAIPGDDFQAWLTELGAFVMHADPGAALLDRWFWLQTRLRVLVAQRVMVHARPGDVLAGLAARAVAADYGRRLYLLHHSGGESGLVPDLVSARLMQATHLLATAAQKPMLRRRFAALNVVPGHLHLARLPKGFDPALNPAIDLPPENTGVNCLGQGPNGGETSVVAVLKALFERFCRKQSILRNKISSLVPQTSPVSATSADLRALTPAEATDFAGQIIGLLTAGKGRHLHFGPVSLLVTQTVQRSLAAAELDPDKVVFTGAEVSVANALRWHRVTLFLGSLPGIETLGFAEAQILGVPVALHSGMIPAEAAGSRVIVWDQPEVLFERLRAPQQDDPDKNSRHDRLLDPARFTRRLRRILDTTEGPLHHSLPAKQQREIAAQLFDAEWYLERNPDVATSGKNPLDHYLRWGEQEGRAPNPLFYPRHYAANLPEADRPKTGLLAHYALLGEKRGHTSHPFFVPQYCARFLPAADAPEDAPDSTVLGRYLRHGGGFVAPHPLFDPVHYAKSLALPPDDQPLLLHFLGSGAAEGFSPHPLIESAALSAWGGNPLDGLIWWLSRPGAGPEEPSPALLFDPVYFCADEGARYAKAAPNLLWAHLIEGNRADRGPHPLVEPAWVARRRPEVLTHNARPILMEMVRGRLDGTDTHPLVSVSYILAQAPGVAQSGQHPTRYFTERAVSENLNPHPWFSTQVYLVNSPDVAQTGQNPLLHYLACGQYEGRLPHLFFDGNDYFKRYLRDAGGGSPLLDYARRGAGAFLPVLPHDAVQLATGLKAVRALFSAGAAPDEAVSLLRGVLHPDWGAPHPTLQVRSYPRAKPSDAPDCRVIHPSAEVVLSRPAVMSGAYLAPPAIRYTAPEVTAALWPRATVIGGNDGFLTAAKTWWAEGPEAEVLPDTAEAADADRRLRSGTALVARRDDAVLIRHHRAEAGLARAIFACGSRSQQFDHFLLEVLPRAIAATERAPAGTPVVTEDDLPPQHYQALRLALPGNPIIRIARGAPLAVAELFEAGMANILGTPKVDDDPAAQPGPAALRLHPALMARLNTLTMGMTISPETRSGRRLFLCPAAPSRRGILNIEEVTLTLAGFGFALLHPETLSFGDLLRHVAQADEIVIAEGPHLAALALARPGCRACALLSNAPGTDFHRADLLGRLAGLSVITLAGWQVQGSAGPQPAVRDAHFTIPVGHIAAFFACEQAGPIADAPVSSVLTELYGLSDVADVLTGAWAVVSGATPGGFSGRLLALRRAAVSGVLASADMGAGGLLAHRFFTDYGRALRSGFAAFADQDADEQAEGLRVVAALNRLAPPPQTGRGNRDDSAGTEPILAAEARRLLMLAMLLVPNWRARLPADPAALPEDVLERWLHWATLPPFLSHAGDDAAWVAHVARLLNWVADGLDRTQNGTNKADIALRKRLLRLISGLDLGQLLLVDVALNAVQAARNRVLDHVALRSGSPRVALRPQMGTRPKQALTTLTEPVSGAASPAAFPVRRRIGLLCRTFEKGPDSEAVVAFFKGFDKSRYEIFAYSVGFRDRVVSRDPAFDARFDAAIEHRRELPADPSGIRAQILADDLDVFLYANATTYGIQPMDIALYHRVAPLQIVLNSHLPMAMGYPSFDAVLTGQSDDPGQEVPDSQHSEYLQREPGPVISYLTSLQPRPHPVLDRAALGLRDRDVVMMNAGSSLKLRYESLKTMMQAVAGVPDGVLLLAPYNPGWAARSLAFAFNTQVAATAAEVGLDPSRIKILGELSVAEAEAALSCADLYLNPFPHGGATMTHLALIYGVPPVTLRRRSTRSIDQFLVSSLGFPELLASTPEAYIALAQSLALNPEKRQNIANRLRKAARHPVFVDSADHSGQMQSAIEKIIRRTTRLTIT